MKDDRTYIKLFRQMLDWGWYGDTNTVRVFLHILLRANYEESEYLGHKIAAGECVFGYNAWSKELGLSVRQLRTAIEHLKSTSEIRVRTTNRFSIITVVKWEFWQVEEGLNDKQTTSQPTSKRQTADKQATTSKESKNTNNKPNIDEIRAYTKENNLIIDPDYFYKFYETAGWVDTRGKPVKNWKLKALNWDKKERERKDVQPYSRTDDRQRRGVSGSIGRGGNGTEIVGATIPRVGLRFEEEE